MSMVRNAAKGGNVWLLAVGYSMREGRLREEIIHEIDLCSDLHLTPKMWTWKCVLIILIIIVIMSLRIEAFNSSLMRW